MSDPRFDYDQNNPLSKDDVELRFLALSGGRVSATVTSDGKLRLCLLDAPQSFFVILDNVEAELMARWVLERIFTARAREAQPGQIGQVPAQGIGYGVGGLAGGWANRG